MYGLGTIIVIMLFEIRIKLFNLIIIFIEHSPLF